MASPKLSVISNSSPLINLSKLNRLDLLQNLYNKVIIPSGVYQEVVVEAFGRPGSIEIQKLCDNGQILIKEVNNTNLVSALNKDLDKGEAEVIALALETEHNLLLLDETEARKMVSSYNLKFTGFSRSFAKSL